MPKLNIAQDGVKKTEKRNLDFVAGTNIDITITDGDAEDAAEIRIDATAGGGGHTIQDDDASVTARTKLSFQDGFVVTDDAVGDQTEIDLSYEATPSTQNYSDAAAGGSAITAARGDHKHGFPAAGSGAPADADYLVGTSNTALSAEIVVGATPGGELGGTWASPTVDATHAGTTHSAATDTHIADASASHAASAVSVDSTTLVGTGTDVQAVFEELDDLTVALAAPDYLVGTATGTLGAEIVAGTAPGGELGGTWGSPTVDATHSGSSHAGVVTTHEAAADPHAGYLKETDFDDIDFLVGTATGHTAAEIVVGTAPAGELGGTWASPTVDATHSGSAHHAQAHGAADHTDISRTIWLTSQLFNDATTAVVVGTIPDAVSTRSHANAATQGLGYYLVMPADYSAGTDVGVDIYYSPDGAAAANVRFRLNWAVIETGAQQDETGTTANWTQAMAGTTDVHAITTRQTFTPTGLAAGDLLRIWIHRLGSDAADTFTGTFRSIGWNITYTATQ